ncbi:MAG: glycosyl transferase family 36 [Calditrichaeota bacterium]|nr:glycosyl transferase family 36 [Calditrichota bacterium]
MNKLEMFKNKYGYFSEDGFEFVITNPDTPRPWVNVISNGDFGLVVSQAGGGFSWKTHVSLNRLTRWNQDLIKDDWGKWLYLRDVEKGTLRSLSWQPVQAEYKKYQVRHGLGYTVFEQKFDDIETSWTLFAAKDAPLEIWLVKIKNTSAKTKKLQLSSYLEWNLGAAPDVNREFHKIFIDTKFVPQNNLITATKTLWEIPTERGHWNTDWPYVGFHSINCDAAGWDCSKDDLLGRHGGYHNPKGIKQGTFTKKSGRFQDAVASLAGNLEIEPGNEQTVVFLLGQLDKNDTNDSLNEAQKLCNYYHDVKNCEQELQNVKDFWKELTGRVNVKTPDAAFNLLTNVWLKYQAISGHLWARTGYFQQSGAFGYRDQMQTSQVWLPLDPQKMLEHVKLNSRHQFKEGTVLHWWHPLSEQGLRTGMTDDLLWMPFMLTKYIYESGNSACLRDVEPFYDGDKASLQEHCIRAIDVVLKRFSERGLPLIGEGDWCDGFSAVGLDWKGESIWLGMFLYEILNRWQKILTNLTPDPDPQKAAYYAERASLLKNALNTHGWNGHWYIAATKDDGTPIGDPSQEECKIYLMSQTWAILSGVADDERRKMISSAMLEHLESDNGFQLFQPAFSKSDPFIGYITRYAPGLRENGGVYTHASTWGVLAMTEQKMPDDALRIFHKLNPILQSEKDADRYQAEPYVLPGNVDGKDSPYYGRAGWSWYTGSAGWLFSIAHEAICGVKASFNGLLIDPCIPAHWDQLSVTRNFRGAVFNISIKNPEHKTGGVKSILLDGKKINSNLIPPQQPGTYQVEIILEGI